MQVCKKTVKEENIMRLKKSIAFSIILALLTALTSSFAISANEQSSEPVLVAAEASEWTALFDRREKAGWLGADGIYSVALDGNDTFGSATADTNTFFIFSDTLMGLSSKSGKLTYNAGMPAQSSAIFNGNEAEGGTITFVYGNGGNGKLGQHMFGEHKWMLDCYVQDSTLYILGFPEQSWKPTQIDLISIPIRDGAPVYGEYRETENVKELWHKIGDEYLYAFGIGITASTAAAGATEPDGYIYVYGYRDAMKEMSRKDLIVGRIHETDFPDFSKFTYWNGEGWGNNIEESAVLLTDVSCEMSVSYIPVGPYEGKYIAIYTQYTRSSNIMYAIADTPYGPFDTPIKCYHAAEHGEVGASGEGTRVVYNAKAHPHLSKGDKLLISYNVNVEGDGVEQWTTDYHPRFIWLDLDPGNTESDVDPSADSSPGLEDSARIAIFAILTVPLGIAVFLIFKKRRVS